MALALTCSVSSVEAQVPPTGIAGVLRDATTGAGIQGGCVAAFATAGPGPPVIVNVDDDGSWNLDSGVAGDHQLAFYTTASGNCFDPIQTTPVPSWFENQPLNGTDPNSITPPNAATAVAAGSSGVIACLGAASLAQSCVEPTTQLSGSVVTVGQVPVAAACVFILGPRTVSAAITDADGSWSVSGLPVASPLVVGVVPPFDIGSGPCAATTGPPPVSPAGQLQPVFYEDIWIDLANPALSNDPNGFALAAGATPFTVSTADIITCLTAAAADVVPRPTCDRVAPTSTDPGSTAVPVTLPASGTRSAPLALGAGALAFVGAITVLIGRRRSTA